MAKVPVTVVTGFLGSGKTTLLNRALRNPLAKNTVVIVNEFGEIGLDHELIESSNDSVILLENGCLCCSVRGDLVDTLIDLIQKRQQGAIPQFDHVVIETSGLAEPTPIVEVINSEPGVKSAFRLSGVVTTVDAVNGRDTLINYEQSIKQIALADRILLTKTDISEASIALLEHVNKLNPQCEIVDSRSIDVNNWFRFISQDASTTGWEDFLPPEKEDTNPSGSNQHLHNSKINRFSIVRETPWDMNTLRMLIDALKTNAGPALLRVKGIINLVESPDSPAVINGAQQLVHSLSWLKKWPSEDRRTRIVFITMDLNSSFFSELIEYIEKMANRTKLVRQEEKKDTHA